MKQAIPPKIDFLIKMPKDTLKKGVFFSFYKKNLTFLKNFYQNAHFSTSNRYNIYRRVFQKTTQLKIFSKRKANRQQLIKELKEIDLNTCISTYFIRCLCNSKKVLSLTAGNKVLVNPKTRIEED